MLDEERRPERRRGLVGARRAPHLIRGSEVVLRDRRADRALARPERRELRPAHRDAARDLRRVGRAGRCEIGRRRVRRVCRLGVGRAPRRVRGRRHGAVEPDVRADVRRECPAHRLPGADQVRVGEPVDLDRDLDGVGDVGRDDVRRQVAGRDQIGAADLVGARDRLARLRPVVVVEGGQHRRLPVQRDRRVHLHDDRPLLGPVERLVVLVPDVLDVHQLVGLGERVPLLPSEEGLLADAGRPADDQPRDDSRCAEERSLGRGSRPRQPVARHVERSQREAEEDGRAQSARRHVDDRARATRRAGSRPRLRQGPSRGR